jgi:hypothetical protein
MPLDGFDLILAMFVCAGLVIVVGGGAFQSRRGLHPVLRERAANQRAQEVGDRGSSFTD